MIMNDTRIVIASRERREAAIRDEIRVVSFDREFAQILRFSSNVQRSKVFSTASVRPKTKVLNRSNTPKRISELAVPKRKIDPDR